MNVKYIVSIIVSFLILAGCSSVMKMFTGIRDIRIESTKDLKDFCLKNSLNTDEAYYFKADQQYKMPDSSHINFQFADQVLVFNENGDRIIYQGKETGYYCSLPGSDFFSGMNSIFMPVDTINTLDNIIGNYFNLETDIAAKPIEADFYLVYYWAKWYEKFSKRGFEGIPPILNNANDSLRIQCFYLNNDFVDINYPEDLEFKKFKIILSL
jgi:hypothetical protein